LLWKLFRTISTQKPPYSSSSRQVIVNVNPSTAQLISVPHVLLGATVTVNRTEEASHLNTLGKTILFTSQDAWSPEMVIQAFRNKYLVEEAFKDLKDPLLVAIRPMFHWTDACIRAHVFTCVLGLLLLSLLRKELIDHGIIASFRHILETLAELSLTAIFTSSTGPELYRLNKISPEASAMARHLGLLKMVPK